MDKIWVSRKHMSRMRENQIVKVAFEQKAGKLCDLEFNEFLAIK